MDTFTLLYYVCLHTGLYRLHTVRGEKLLLLRTFIISELLSMREIIN